MSDSNFLYMLDLILWGARTVFLIGVLAFLVMAAYFMGRVM